MAGEYPTTREGDGMIDDVMQPTDALPAVGSAWSDAMAAEESRVRYSDPTASAFNSDDYARGYNAGAWCQWDGHALAEGTQAREDYDRGYDDGVRVHASMVAREARAALAREDARRMAR